VDRQPLISVVVPTRDRPAALRRCLDALAAQTRADELEVIVVDDGSVAGDEVSQLVASHPRGRLIRRSGQGPAAARNAGARDAQGAFLCFVDDDCEPQREWVDRLVERLQRDADGVAGMTLSGEGALAAASEIVARAPARVQPSDGNDVAFAPSNNLACTKAAFDATPFDESYPHAAGEDREWCARLTAAGYALRSEPEARLVHHQDLTFGRFIRQQVRYGEGAFRFRRFGSYRRPLESASFYRGLVQEGFAESLSVGLLVCFAQVATAAGFLRAWTTARLPGSGFTDRTSREPSGRDGS
jgi:glycosyltransferase involved in cell wall biosynthesis